MPWQSLPAAADLRSIHAGMRLNVFLRFEFPPFPVVPTYVRAPVFDLNPDGQTRPRLFVFQSCAVDSENSSVPEKSSRFGYPGHHEFLLQTFGANFPLQILYCRQDEMRKQAGVAE